ncbi:hypothetical protein ABB25_11870 [Stenotrophomonas koreensis]|uniref:Uncharacterized protein n=1 Tax=Stenotrophomonas koreensis TaxID=266128 RepID=A0A0R0BP12_9GAMM|nr:hypothetical protein ABB25_11870 [Stenotrophomonas koreensis]
MAPLSVQLFLDLAEAMQTKMLVSRNAIRIVFFMMPLGCDVTLWVKPRREATSDWMSKKETSRSGGQAAGIKCHD